MKRNMVTLLAMAMSLFAAAQEKTYCIKGTAAGHDGMKVMLTAEDKTPIDSAVVADGKFLLTGPLSVQMAMLRMGGTTEAFILHENPIDVTFQMVKTERRGIVRDLPELRFSDDKEYELLKSINDMQMLEVMTMMAIALGKDEQTETMRDSLTQMYLGIKERNKTLQDSIASRMDMLNNMVGARIGTNNPHANYDAIVAIVRRHVIDGKCWKIRKKDNNTYLDADGKPIDIHYYDNHWAIPKVLVPSNKQ